MTRTARLSRRFYETFGDENTNELVGLLNAMDATHIDELRALNESNALRFEAKLDQRMAELGAEMQAMGAKLQGKAEAIGERLTAGLDGMATAETVRANANAVTVGFATMRGELAQSQLSILKWLVGILVPSLGAIIGVLIALVRRP